MTCGKGSERSDPGATSSADLRGRCLEFAGRLVSEAAGMFVWGVMAAVGRGRGVDGGRAGVCYPRLNRRAGLAPSVPLRLSVASTPRFSIVTCCGHISRA
jgi:hypothetical protein